MSDKIILFAILFLMIIVPVYALEAGVCITAELTDISPTSIKVGDPFTIGILIDNCGEKIPENISFELMNVSPFIEVKDALKKEIGKMGYANSQRFILYHMKAAENAIPGNYVLEYRLTYSNDGVIVQKDNSFFITIIGDKAELGIASIKTNPVLPFDGEIVEMTIRIENTGKGDANSVKVYAEHPFQGLKQSFIGNLESGEDGPAVLTFIAGKAGEYNLPIIISYTDDLGEREINTNVEISILEKSSNIKLIIFILVLVAVIIWGVVYSIRKSRAKDRVIHQLLRDNSEKKR